MQVETNIENAICQLVDDIFIKGESNQEKEHQLKQFQKNIANLDLCKKLLTDTKNSSIIHSFAANAIHKITKLYVSTWTINYSIDLCDWIVKYMLENTEPSDKHPPFSSLSSVVALIFDYFLVSSKNECSNEWKDIISIFDGIPTDWIIGLYLLSSIYDELLVSEHEQVQKIFKNEYAHCVFQCAYNCLEKTSFNSGVSSDLIIDLSTKIISKYLRDKPEYYTYSEDRELFFGNQCSNRLNEELKHLELYFKIFQERPTQSALECIENVAKAIDTYPDQWKPKIICLLLNRFSDIISQQIGFDVEMKLIQIMSVLSTLSRHLKFSIIQQATNLDLKAFLTKMFDLTMVILQIPIVYSLDAIQVAIDFWTNFEKALRNDANVEPKKYLAQFAQPISIQYIELLLSITSASNDISEMPRIDPLDIPQLSEAKFLSPIESFVILNSDAICPSIINKFQMVQSQLEESLAQGIDTSQLEMAMVCFVEIATIIIKIKKLNNHNNPQIKYHSDFFYLLIELLQASEKFPSSGILLPRLEMALILFIWEFKTTQYSNADSQYSKKLYAEISRKRCAIKTCQMCQAYFFERLISTLRYYNNSKILIDKVLTIIQADYGFKSLVDLVNPDVFDHIFSCPLEGTFAFLNDFNFRSLRSRFYSTIYNILSQLNNGQHYFFILLDFLDHRFSSISVESVSTDIEQQKALFFLAIDLTGIFNAIKAHYQFNPFFDWFIIADNRADIFICSFDSLCNYIDKDNHDQIHLISIILKMWKSVVLNIPPTRIVVEPNSSNGVYLFKRVASSLIAFSSFVEKSNIKIDSPDDLDKFPYQIFKGIRYYAMIIQSLLCGQYVLFDAFKIYNDSVFTDLLEHMVKMFSHFKVVHMFHYPRIWVEILRMFRDLLNNQIQAVFECKELLDIILQNTFEFLFMNESEFEEHNELSIEILFIFLKYIYDEEIDINPYMNYINTMNKVLWFLLSALPTIESEKIGQISNIIKYLYVTYPASLDEIQSQIQNLLLYQARLQFDMKMKQLKDKLNNSQLEIRFDALVPILQDIYIIIRPFDVVFI